ncbi:MAG: DUF1349 domain-containing protein [Brevinema sp.]
MNDFLTLNDAIVVENNNKIVISAREKTDFFVNPETDQVIANAAFAYKNVEGDFVMQAKVSHQFQSTYDACVLFAFENERKWAKACFEATDFNTKAVVSVMTDGNSDDANGVNVEDKSVWLRLSRKGNVFAVHYSTDNKNFYMARICSIIMNKEIKVGLVAQSPTGLGGEMIFEEFSLEKRTLNDIRQGV